MAVRQGGLNSFRTPQRDTLTLSMRQSTNSTPRRVNLESRRTPAINHLDNQRERSGIHSDDEIQSTGVTCNQNISADIKEMYEQQLKLTSKVEEVLEGMKTSGSRQRCSIPRELSAIIHDCYQKLIEDDDNQQWNFSVRFDDPNNRQVNRELIANVMAINDKLYDATLIKRALRTYFKSKKTEDSKRKSGRSSAFAASARKRQRRHNKAKARLRVLRQSTTLDEAAKKKIEPVLQGKYMSSEESLIEDSTDNEQSDDREHSSDSDKEHTRTGKKKLIRHKLPWRSREFERVIESLDRKLDRRRNTKSKAMCLKFEVGEPSSRERPDDLPEWASNIHHELFES